MSTDINEFAPTDKLLPTPDDGWRLFPIAGNAKTPALPGNWRDHATADEARIQGWLDEGLNLALHLEAAGIAVIDLDGPDALALWPTLGECPPTYTVQTPHGRHLYFRGRLRPSVGKLGHKIDTRGIGSYVLVEPSEIGGQSYRIIDGRDPVPLPAWIPAALDAASPQKEERAAVAELDLAVNISRGIRYLQALPIAVQRQGADEKTYEAAAELRDYGISPDKSIELMLAHYKLEPRDERFEAFITRKVENAEAYAQNQAGAWGVAPLDQTFAAVVGEIANEEAETRLAKAGRFTLRSEAMQDARPPITWLVEGLLQDPCNAVIHAPWNSYKSFWAIDVALAVASGLPAFGHFKVNRQGPVIYLAGEGLAGIETMRRPAWRAARKIAPDKALPFYTIDNVPRVADEADVTACMDAIKAAVSGELQGGRPVLIVIDTMSRAMPGLNENEAGDATKYLNAAEAIRQAFGCTVLTVAHEGKDGEKGLRGSSAFSGGFDIILRMDAHLDGLSASVSSPKIKDGSPIEPFGLIGCEVQLGGDKHSLVFDWADPSDFRGAKARKLTRLALGAALAELKAEKGQTVTTDQLAMFLAGEFAADEKVVSGWKRDLQRRAKADFRAYVHTLGKGGRGSATLWTLGDPPAEEITV